MTNSPLFADQLSIMDNEIRNWAHQGFEDIAMIVTDDNNPNIHDEPVLAEDDIIRQRVTAMETRGGDLFVFINTGEILHYRMTVTRL